MYVNKDINLSYYVIKCNYMTIIACCKGLFRCKNSHVNLDDTNNNSFSDGIEVVLTVKQNQILYLRNRSHKIEVRNRFKVQHLLINCFFFSILLQQTQATSSHQFQ